MNESKFDVIKIGSSEVKLVTPDEHKNTCYLISPFDPETINKIKDKVIDDAEKCGARLNDIEEIRRKFDILWTNT